MNKINDILFGTSILIMLNNFLYFNPGGFGAGIFVIGMMFLMPVVLITLIYELIVWIKKRDTVRFLLNITIFLLIFLITSFKVRQVSEDFYKAKIERLEKVNYKN